MSVSLKSISDLRRKPFIKNTGWIIFERVYQMVVSLFVGLYTARYLGPSNFGIINYVTAFIAFATPVCALGMDGVVVKALVDKTADEGRIIGTSIIMRFAAGLASAIVIIAIVAITNPGSQVHLIIALLLSVGVLFRSIEIIEFWYQSKLRSKTASIVKVIGYTVMSLYRVALLMLNMSVEWFAFATSLDILVIAVLYLVLFKKHCKAPLKWDWPLGRSLLRGSYHFMLSGVVVVLYSQMDKILIKEILKSEAQVGLYSAANTICSLWFFIPVAIIGSARPVIMALKKTDEKAYLRRLKQLYSVIAWSGILVSVVFTVFSKLIIQILYGADYAGAASVLAIMGWYGVFAQLGLARGIWILCENKNKYVKMYTVWGVVVNVSMNLLLLPRIGILGSGIATLAAQITVCLVAPLFYKETRVNTKLILESFVFKWN